MQKSFGSLLVISMSLRLLLIDSHAQSSFTAPVLPGLTDIKPEPIQPPLSLPGNWLTPHEIEQRSLRIHQVIEASGFDFQRLATIDRFTYSGLLYRDSQPVIFGPLVLTGPTTVVAEHVIICGEVSTEGFPLTIVARTVEFAPLGFREGSYGRISGYSSYNRPQNQVDTPLQAAPGNAGTQGIAGFEGNQTPGRILITALNIIGSPEIRGNGQSGGFGGRGGVGGAGIDGERGAPGGRGGNGGRGGAGGQGGQGGRSGAPIPVEIRYGRLITRPRELPPDISWAGGSAPGERGPGGSGGAGGRGGRGGGSGPGGINGLWGEFGPSGAEGELGPTTEISPSIRRLSLNDIAIAQEAVFRSAIWVHLWRNFRVRLEELNRMIVRVAYRLHEEGARPDYNEALRSATVALTHFDEEMHRDLQDLRSYPALVENERYYTLYDYIYLAIVRRPPAYPIQTAEAQPTLEEFATIFYELLRMKSEFLSIGLSPTWAPSVQNSIRRLDNLRTTLFDDLRHNCVQLAEAQRAHVDDLVGVFPIFSIPLCDPGPGEADFSADLRAITTVAQ